MPSKRRIITGGIVDVETTGLSPTTDEIIELGILLFEYDLARGRYLGVVDEYVGLREPACRLHPEAAAVNGLTMGDLRGRCLDHSRVITLLQRTDLLIAHNAPFDRRFMEALFPIVKTKNWCCSMSGINWLAKGFPNRRLQDLLQRHSIFSTSAHRAQADVRATLELLTWQQSDGSSYLAELLGRQKWQERSG